MKKKHYLIFYIIAIKILCSCLSDLPVTHVKIPTISTTSVSEITGSTAQCGGNITGDGGSIITERGVVWGLASEPTISLPTKTSDGVGAGDFKSSLTGLNFSTTYFVRAYASNSAGTAYGDEVVIKTLADLTPVKIPTISTTPVSEITGSTAQCGGNITGDGGSIITERGIVWGLASGPTISLPTKTSDGDGAGDFKSSLAGLNFNTTYFVRAYATNSAGTAYGDEVVLKTLADLSGVYVCGIDGPGISVAAYWKDGVLTDLLTDRSIVSGANAIFVTGSDVYAVGYQRSAIKYWKNNNMVDVTDGSHSADAFSIAISGSDVYIGGYEQNSLQKPVAKIWKNGIATSLSDGTTEAGISQIVVANGDIYAAGYDQVGLVDPTTFNSNYKAIYWKNGIRFDLTDGTTIAIAKSIFVDGSDIYVVGYRRNSSGYDIPMLWKNGIGTELTDGTASGIATSVYVSNGDVHIVGRVGSWATSIWTIKYWKNYNPTTLAQSQYANSQSVIVKGNDVYILYNDGSNSILLKNGDKVAPYDGNSPKILARGLFIK